MKPSVATTSVLLLSSVMSVTAIAQTPQIAKSWTGFYNDEQKISLFFDQNGSQLSGYSILNGKTINYTGNIKAAGNGYRITLNEAGKGAAVGKFVLKYSSNTKPMDAEWQSSSSKVRPKFFTLDAQQCRYDKSAGNFVASERLLTDADLQVPLGELQYMRNEIYARHGYAFKNKDWAVTFSYADWYMPCYTNVEDKLTAIEQQNIRRIKLVEPYAQEESWGR